MCSFQEQGLYCSHNETTLPEGTGFLICCHECRWLSRTGPGVAAGYGAASVRDGDLAAKAILELMETSSFLCWRPSLVGWRPFHLGSFCY